MLLIQVIHVAQAVLILVIVPLLLVPCGGAVAKGRRRRAAVFGIGGVIALGLYTCSGVESYCYLYPSIDTRYAPGFSERKFAEVRAGMSMDEVITCSDNHIIAGVGEAPCDGLTLKTENVFGPIGRGLVERLFLRMVG